MSFRQFQVAEPSPPRGGGCNAKKFQELVKKFQDITIKANKYDKAIRDLNSLKDRNKVYEIRLPTALQSLKEKYDVIQENSHKINVTLKGRIHQLEDILEICKKKLSNSHN